MFTAPTAVASSVVARRRHREGSVRVVEDERVARRSGHRRRRRIAGGDRDVEVLRRHARARRPRARECRRSCTAPSAPLGVKVTPVGQAAHREVVGPDAARCSEHHRAVGGAERRRRRRGPGERDRRTADRVGRVVDQDVRQVDRAARTRVPKADAERGRDVADAGHAGPASRNAGLRVEVGVQHRRRREAELRGVGDDGVVDRVSWRRCRRRSATVIGSTKFVPTTVIVAGSPEMGDPAGPPAWFSCVGEALTAVIGLTL